MRLSSAELSVTVLNSVFKNLTHLWLCSGKVREFGLLENYPDISISAYIPSKWTLNKEHLKMCGFKCVLTNRGTAEWAVWCRAEGGGNAWLGRPPVVNNTRTAKRTKLRLYLQCFCLSVVSLSLQLAAPSDLDLGWRREAVKLTQGLQLFTLPKNLRDLQMKLYHCALRTQRCQCSQWFIFSNEREYLKAPNIRD